MGMRDHTTNSCLNGKLKLLLDMRLNGWVAAARHCLEGFALSLIPQHAVKRLRQLNLPPILRQIICGAVDGIAR